MIHWKKKSLLSLKRNKHCWISDHPNRTLFSEHYELLIQVNSPQTFILHHVWDNQRPYNIKIFTESRVEKISPVSLILCNNLITSWFPPIKMKKEQNVRNQIEKLPLLSNPDGSVMGFFPELCQVKNMLEKELVGSSIPMWKVLFCFVFKDEACVGMNMLD